MRFGVQLIIVFILSAVLTNCKKETSDILYNKKYIKEIKAARNEMGLFLTRNQIPGATVAISKNGELIYSEGMGLASKDLEVPATRETKFRIGEVSEIFTSFIYLRMVEDGLLQPDSSIQHYIPDFPEKEFKITLHHLANHVSGFRDPTMNEKDSRMQNITLQKGLDIFKEDRILSPPQTYQTINIFEYNLLGAIMEKATNKKFREILQEYCTDTLKLTNTTIDNPFVTIKGRTNFYNHDIIANIINATFRDFRYSAPSQGLLSNAEDLVKLGNAILYSDILSQETKEKIFKTVTLLDNSQTNLANGWVIIIDKNDDDLYGKKGSIMGGSSSILIYPKYGLVIASATNLLPNNESAPVFEMAEYFIDQETDKKETKE